MISLVIKASMGSIFFSRYLNFYFIPCWKFMSLKFGIFFIKYLTDCFIWRRRTNFRTSVLLKSNILYLTSIPNMNLFERKIIHKIKYLIPSVHLISIVIYKWEFTRTELGGASRHCITFSFWFPSPTHTNYSGVFMQIGKVITSGKTNWGILWVVLGYRLLKPIIK